ncbi:MAG: hypothetical protein PHQ80_04455 [Candidatus ainarchaeum sp.]|nr:hypothetical protein [Candidatus ainarchaeum sp.]
MRAARAALALALVVAFSFACADPLSCVYSDPPIDVVMAHNFNASFLQTLANNPEENFSLFSATLIGIFPSVEGRVPADAGTYQILWTWGENYSTIVHVTDRVEGSGGCADVNDGDFSIYDIAYSFKIKVDNETINWTDAAPTEVPYFNLSLGQERMERYNATEKMEVTLEYNVTYTYIEEHLTCVYFWSTEESNSSNLSYYVENGNVTFFTARPVLGEQWYRNNHFDNLVFSNKRMYKSEIYLDGAKVGEAHVLNFSIYNDTYGAWFINSSRDENYTNTTMGEHEIIYSPIPMIHNNESFRYLYEENYSYSGIGRHNLTLVLTDDFNRTYNYSKELLSRAAGAQEAAEEGVDYAYARPTYEKPEESLTQVIIPTGALAVIFIVVLASTWWGMTGAKRI